MPFSPAEGMLLAAATVITDALKLMVRPVLRCGSAFSGASKERQHSGRVVSLRNFTSPLHKKPFITRCTAATTNCTHSKYNAR